MENASKALIIAGAILISILLISVAIMVISSTQGTQDQMTQQMDATEKSTFNAQFTNFIGENRSASQVKALFEKVTASNASNSNFVYIQYKAKSGSYAAATSATMSTLSTKSKYKITIEDQGIGLKTGVPTTKTPDGLYDVISIEEK